MSLSELISGIVASERTLTVFNPTPGIVGRLAEHFANQNVSVVSASSDEGPSNYTVLGTGDEFHTAVSVDDLLAHPEDVEPGFERGSYAPILDHLDETLFTSYNRQQVLNTTRKIEDRTWRVGAGELHSGFQSGGNLRPQLETYRRLSGHDDLSVHAYIYPNGEVPQADQFQLHLAHSDEIRRSWFVAYDGNSVGDYKRALAAEETEPGFGLTDFWTYDPLTVDYIVNHLVSPYSIIESDGSGDDADDGYQLTT